MNSSIIRRVFVLGAIAIIGIIAMQAYWVTNTWNLNEEEFDQKVHSVLLNVAKKLVKLKGSTLPLDIVKRQSPNYYIVNLEIEIDANELEYYLSDQFQEIGMNANYEYGIHDCSSNQMVYGKYIKFSEEKKDVTLGELPKYEEFTYYFGVKFPDRSGFLLGKMQLAVFLSILLFMTVLFFAYSMFVILRQSRLSEMQKDFINNMTHEFKTPISTIKISSDVFLKNPTIQKDSRLMRYAQIIKEQNQRLNNQVEKVLQLAKIEQNSFQLNKEYINLHQLLQSVLESARVNTDFSDEIFDENLNAFNPTVLADKLHLSNILHSLLDNAIKYCKDKPRIAITTKDLKQGREIELEIKDQGIGINKEYLPKIFKKFYRVPTGNIHNVKGFGLGLYYVKSVCDVHDWKINIDSEEGKGTTIKIILRTNV